MFTVQSDYEEERKRYWDCNNGGHNFREYRNRKYDQNFVLVAVDLTRKINLRPAILNLFMQVQGDNGLYLEIKIYDFPMIGLLDSAATHSIVRANCWQTLKNFVSRKTSTVQPNSQSCLSRELPDGGIL